MSENQPLSTLLQQLLLQLPQNDEKEYQKNNSFGIDKKSFIVALDTN